MQIPEWKEADSKVKGTLVPEGKGCRFQRKRDDMKRKKGCEKVQKKSL
jgi:hypothetical protein